MHLLVFVLHLATSVEPFSLNLVLIMLVFPLHGHVDVNMTLPSSLRSGLCLSFCVKFILVFLTDSARIVLGGIHSRIMCLSFVLLVVCGKLTYFWGVGLVEGDLYVGIMYV